MQTNFVSTVLVLGLAACGGSDLDPGAGNDPGTGTGTLAIEGSVQASSRMLNARTSAEFDTEFTVRVSLNDQTVTTGTVTVTSASGTIPLTYTTDGRWTGRAASYEEVYILDVESGPDNVAGVRVDGPDIHVFSAPTAGAIVDPTMPLMVRWNRDDTADTARIRAENVDSIEIPDSGSYALAAGSLKADTAEARQHMLRLTRTNSVVPAGTTAGSIWNVRIENEINVVTAAQPL
jgi:hypothetical protein